MSILFLDISTKSTGYAIVEFDMQTRIASILELGVIKFHEDSELGYRYNTFSNILLNDFYTRGTDIVVAEEYFFNTKTRRGCMAVPNMHGALMSACWEVQPNIDWRYVSMSDWKKTLTGRARINGVKGKAEKERIEKKIRELYKGLPEILVNPVTKQDNKTPNDLYDVLGIVTHWFSKCGAVKVDQQYTQVNYDLYGSQFKKKKEKKDD